MVCVFASCSDGGSDNPVNPTPKPEEVKTEITIDSGIISNGLSFASSQGEQSISFSVNADWTLSVASTTSGTTWCKASATNGGKGSANVKFTIDENTSYDDRSVSVTIKAGTVSKTFTITQKGADAMLVTTTKYEVAQEGGKIEVEVKANVDYQFAISETATAWITEAKSKSRGLTTYKHTFEIANNEDVEKREGEITFKSGDKVETVKVYQAGGALILLSQNEYTVSDAGDTISVDIKSNVEYGVQMPDVDWITDEASSRGMSSHTLMYVITANESYDNRSAEIIFYDKNSELKDTLKVVQVQKDAIVISQKIYDVKAEGDTIEVKLSANVDFEVTMPEVDWISRTESRALTEKSIYLKVEKNTNEESRNVKILFVNKESQISDSITINQAGFVKAGYADGVVSIATAGTMKKLLGDDYLKITSLKVVGPINGDDVYYLRKMLGGRNFSEAQWGKLHTLDLSEASIVNGGEWYYEHELDYRKYYTQKDQIGDYMFKSCKNLQNIVLPNNVTSIGDYSFSSCDGLTSITIPDGVTSIGDESFYNCDGLTNITIPDGVTSIGAGVYANCDGLTSITIPDGVSIGSGAFYNCDGLTSITIPDGVTSIGDGVFSNCDGLTSITIPDGVTSIGVGAFEYCDGLTSITIPDGVTSIGARAFRDCNALTKVVIGNGVTSIGAGAFRDCDALANVSLGNSVTSIGCEAFYNCSITECFCYASKAPILRSFDANDLFYGYKASPFVIGIKEGATLYVPVRCGSDYKFSDWGVFFENIVDMD